jgi:fatty-acyl-CoA synthase
MVSLPNYARISSADRFLVAVPQFHVMAWGLPFGALLAGAVLVLPSSHLQPEALTRIILDEKVNRASGVPTLWQGVYSVLKNVKPHTLQLKNILMGGISAPPSLMDNLKKDFDIETIHAWGMTETSPVATVSRLQPEHEYLSAAEKLRIAALQGQELPFLQIRVITESGDTAPRDGSTVGEIQIRGPWIIQSYFKSNSRESFTHDGWFKTGDVGTINTEGYMMITDRAKDLIKSGGEWISSVALEVTLMAHPKIKEAAVIAIPDRKWDERPLAAIVKKDDAGLISTEELQSFLSASFAKYQIPDRYIFLEAIPKTSVGKFDKKEMRRLYAEGRLQ